jgi:hypothetical protein
LRRKNRHRKLIWIWRICGRRGSCRRCCCERRWSCCWTEEFVEKRFLRARTAERWHTIVDDVWYILGMLKKFVENKVARLSW